MLHHFCVNPACDSYIGLTMICPLSIIAHLTIPNMKRMHRQCDAISQINIEEIKNYSTSPEVQFFKIRLPIVLSIRVE